MISPEDDVVALGELLAVMESTREGAGVKLLNDWTNSKPGRSPSNRREMPDWLLKSFKSPRSL